MPVGGQRYCLATSECGIVVYVLGFDVRNMMCSSSFDFQGQVVLDARASCSMGTVDMPSCMQQKFWEHGLALNACTTNPLMFAVANGAGDSSSEAVRILQLMLRWIGIFNIFNTIGPMLLGEDESLQLVVHLELKHNDQQIDIWTCAISNFWSILSSVTERNRLERRTSFASQEHFCGHHIVRARAIHHK